MTRHARSAAAACLAAATACTPAFAQQATQQDADTIVVTGTRTRDRTVLTSASPIDVLTQADLQRAAGPDGNLAAALQTLLPSFNFPRQSNSSGADHVRAAQLRGLSPDQVLVLVNGKRRQATAVVNLDSKIGKGTNPVDFNSIPLNAIKRVEVLRDGAGAQYGSDAIAGVINVILDDAADGGEIEATLGTQHTHFDPTGDRITDGQAAELRWKQGLRFGNGGTVRFGAEATHRNQTNRSGFDDVASQIDAGFVDDTPGNRALGGKRNYRPGEPDTENYNLWANGGLPLDAGTDVYGFGTVNHRRTLGAAFYRYPDTSQNVLAIYPNGFRPVTTGTNEDVQLAGGVRGAWQDAWTYDVSLNYGRNRFDYGVRNSVNASLGDASPTRFHLADFSADQFTANADVTRELKLAAFTKPATLSFGAEWRRERFETQPGDAASYAIGEFDGAGGAQAGPGLQPGDAVDTARNVWGVYAGFAAPVTDAFQAEAGVRHDHYGDAGGATTGKLAARWALTPQFALRGTVSNNFRAPSLAQSGFSFTVTDRGEGGALTQVRTLPVADPLARQLGATDLKPEKARNASIGLTAQPLPSVSVTLDAYRVDVDGRITLSERIASGDDAYNFFTNAVDTRTDGVDLVAAWTTPVAGGELKTSLASSYARTTLRRIRDEALIGLETRNTLTDATPRDRHVLTFAWHGGPWSTLLRATRHGKTTRVFDFGDGFTPTQTYGAKWQLDLEGEWQVTRAFSVALGGVNVTDAYPDRSIPDIAYFGNLPYDVLSPIGFSGAYYYVRARYSY